MLASSIFDRHTAVVPTSPGEFDAEIDRSWWIDRGPNGGYIAAIICRAVLAYANDPDRHLRTLAVHYLAPPVEGPAQLTVRTIRQGRSVHFLQAEMRQGDRSIATANAVLISLGAAPDLFEDPSFPEYPHPDTIADPPPMATSVPMRDRYVYRHVMGAPGDGPLEQAETGGWIRLAEPRPYDAALVCAITDAWFPSIFLRTPTPMGVPTIDLTIHIRSVRALAAMQPDDWMGVRFRTTIATEGLLEEDGELWAPDGTLIAHSRQLGMILAP